MVDTLLLNVLPRDVPIKNADVHFDTVFELYRLANRLVPGSERAQLLNFLGMRVEIAGRLYSAYGVHGRKAVDLVVDPHWCEVALVLLFSDFLQLSGTVGQEALAFKRLNAIFKLFDFISRERKVSVELREAIDASVTLFLSRYSTQGASETISLAVAQQSVFSERKTLPITVLFWEGPIARAYLATLNSMGYQPEKIIHLISAVDLVSKKPVGRYLPAFMRQGYAQSRQRNSIHYWAGTLRKTEPGLCKEIRLSVANMLNFDVQVLNNALALADLRAYCPDVETLMVDNLADDRLYENLAALPVTSLLFTGGGIVPARCLQLEKLKFIHVHPGYLPDVRGADCVLWSQLIKGRTSASCFYLAPGIDDGDVIFPCYLPKVEISYKTSAIPSKMLYRAVYAFFDPWVRSYVLREAIEATNGFTVDQVASQDESLSTTYHFMHEKIQTLSLARIFID